MTEEKLVNTEILIMFMDGCNTEVVNEKYLRTRHLSIENNTETTLSVFRKQS